MDILKQTFARNEEVAWRSVVDQGLLVHSRQGLVYPMNPVGMRMWLLLEKPLTGEQLVQQLYSEFDASKEKLSEDASLFLTQCSKEDLIRQEAD